MICTQHGVSVYPWDHDAWRLRDMDAELIRVVTVEVFTQGEQYPHFYMNESCMLTA